MKRARQITFTASGYGYGIFPFGECLAAIMDAVDRGQAPEWFEVLNSTGHPRPEFRPYRTETVEPFGHCLVRHDAFTGEPTARTLQHLQEGQEPVLEVHAEGGEARVYYPASYASWEPYTGRVYRPYKADCYSLARDWYADRGLVQLPDGDEADALAWASELGRDFLLEGLERFGFEPVARARDGDLVLIAPEGSLLHAGIVVDGGQLLHHPERRLSNRMPYGPRFQENTRAILRPPEVHRHV